MTQDSSCNLASDEEAPDPVDSADGLPSVLPRFTSPPPAQTGDGAPTRPHHHRTPIRMELAGIMLDDHDLLSLNPYLLQDLQSAQKADARDWCRIVLGKDEAILDTWTKKIKQSRWFHDGVVEEALIEFCAAQRESDRYNAFIQLTNRFLYLARGSLPGVRKKNSYPINDICFANHSDRPVVPIPEHGIIAAERKPDIVIARRVDCDAALVQDDKLKLRWPQIISFVEMKASQNLRKDLENKRLAEGLPLIRQRERNESKTKKARKKPKKTTMKNKPSPLADLPPKKIPTIVSDVDPKLTHGTDTVGAFHPGAKRKLDEREVDDPVDGLNRMRDSERQRRPGDPVRRKAEAATQVGAYGIELLSGTRGTRTSCLSASMRDDKIWFWHYSPTGILYTDAPISLLADFEYFAAVIVALASCTAEQFGALPFNIIKPPDAKSAILLREDLYGHKLTVDHPTTKEPITLTLTRHVFTQYGLTGRRTFVYEAEPSPRNGLPNMIVKCSYQASTRRPENELLKHARKCGVSHLPDVHLWGDLWTIQDIARENYKLSKQRLAKDDKLLDEPEYEDRTFRVIAYSQYYSIRTLLTKHIELMPVMVNQVLDCLHDLRYKANMLHRDISVNNIMWEVRDGDIDFKVIDFDMSVVDDPREDYVASSKHRTGTLPFMAPELLWDAHSAVTQSKSHGSHKPIKHLLRHDITSLFFVCIWSVEVLLAAELRKEDQEEMRENARFLERGGLQAIATYKAAFLTHSMPKWFVKWAPSSECLRAWFRNFGKVFRFATFAIESHVDESDTDALRIGPDSQSIEAFDDETGGGLLSRDHLKTTLTPFVPLRVCTIADIENECIPKHMDGPSIPLELRKPVKETKTRRKLKKVQDEFTMATENFRARLRPRRNGKAVTSR